MLPLLDGVLADVECDMDGAALADTVDTIDGLVQHSRVERKVDDEAVIGAGEVDAKPASAGTRDKGCKGGK